MTHEEMRKAWDEATTKALTGSLYDVKALLEIDRKCREAGVPGFPKLHTEGGGT